MTFRPTCPVCGGRSFKARGTRIFAECSWCGALERTRLLRLCLDHLPPFLPRKPFLHFNPEPALIAGLRSKLGSRYRPCRNGRHLDAGSLEQVDIAGVRGTFGTKALSGVLHSHVIKLDNKNTGKIVGNLNAALAPGGVHLFSAVMNGAEAAERIAALLKGQFAGLDPIPLAEMIDGLDLEEAGVPPEALTSINSNTIFGFQKRRLFGGALKLLPKVRKLCRPRPAEDED